MVLGLAVTLGRAGVTAGRVVLFPARAVGALPTVRGHVRGLESTGRAAKAGARRRLEIAAEDLLAGPEAERAVDHALAGPLPESLARALVQHRVVERVARETLGSRDFDQTLSAALDDERTAQIVERILASDEFEAALKRVMSSPAIREALAEQTAGFADQVAADLRHRADAGWTRPPSAGPAPGSSARRGSGPCRTAA